MLPSTPPLPEGPSKEFALLNEIRDLNQRITKNTPSSTSGRTWQTQKPSISHLSQLVRDNFKLLTQTKDHKLLTEIKLLNENIKTQYATSIDNWRLQANLTQINAIREESLLQEQAATADVNYQAAGGYSPSNLKRLIKQAEQGDFLVLDHKIGSIPPQIFNNKNIRFLVLHHWGNKEFPKELYKMPLFYLALRALPPIETIHPGIGQLKNTLTLLNCTGLNVQELPEELFQLTNLEFLRLEHTQLESLSSNIGKLQKLKNLELERCPFLQTLPSEIGSLAQLKVLTCKNTDLTALPKEIGRCTQLQSIDIRNNPHLTQFPVELGQLQSLEALLCDDSALPHLPAELANCPKLIQIGNLWRIESGISLKDFLINRNISP